jgi:hypothetical protein
MRRMAVSSCGPQSQRALWKMSPVTHDEWTRTITFSPPAEVAVHERHMRLAIDRILVRDDVELAVLGGQFGRRERA